MRERWIERDVKLVLNVKLLCIVVQFGGSRTRFFEFTTKNTNQKGLSLGKKTHKITKLKNSV